MSDVGARPPALPDDLLSGPLADLPPAVRSGACDARALVERSRQRILETDAQLQAWVVLAGDAADRAADLDADRDADRDGGRGGPLAGIPIGVKDLIDVAGLPTRCGSTLTSDEPVTVTAPLVQRLTSLGVVVQGKTVTTEFAYFAPGPTANPRAPGRTPGGSSSGSAAAVAAGHVPLALGSQTAGSTIRPASYCGIAGLVPPQASLDLTGILTICPSLDAPGFFARTVDDLATVAAALEPGMFGDLVGAEATSGVSVRWWGGSGLDEVDPQMLGAVELAVGVLRGGGYDVDALDWDAELQTLSADHVRVMAYEMAEQLGDRVAAHPDRISAQLADLLRAGAAVPGAAYREALARRRRFRRALDDRLGDEEVIIGPATPGPAPLGLAWTGPPSMNRPWQLLGWPQLAVPGAVTSDGLPLGLQVITRPGQENLLLAMGRVLERALRGPRNIDSATRW